MLAGRPLSIAVDVRYDSPGFSANKSTAIFMDYDTKYIVNLEIGDSREVSRQSSRMEKSLVQRGLDNLVYKSSLVIWEVISDASRTILALLQTDQFKHLHHSLDIWHKAKKLAHSLGDISKKSCFRELLPWIRPVVNHFWYCCSSCNGQTDKLLKRWFGILHHVTNQHFWAGGRCHHLPVDASECKKWLKQESPAFRELRKIVINKDWCGSLRYYANCRQTWAIENFNSHTLLHYCPKRVAFNYDSYTMRNQLAVMDYNYHLDRSVLQTDEGEICSVTQFSRKTKQWVAYERKSPKEFSYIPDLMADCLRETYGVSKPSYRKSEYAEVLDHVAVNLSGSDR